MRRALWCCLLISAANGASWAQGISAFPVYSAPGYQHYPVVWGSFVAWANYQGSGVYALQGKRINDSTPYTIAQEYGLTAESAGGGLLLWADQRNGSGNTDIFAYDLAGEQEFPVCTDPGRQFYPHASTDYIVWEDGPYGGAQIYAYNRSTQATVRVSPYARSQSEPRASGDYVVWQEESDPYYKTDIVACDLRTGTRIQVTDQLGTQHQPVISGNIVVWTDLSNGNTNADIYGKNLLTGDVFPICTAPHGQSQPAIDGSIVVWLDSRDWYQFGVLDVYGYDLSTGQEFLIASGPEDKLAPQISGNLVVWEQTISPDNTDIYGAYVPEPLTLSLLLLAAPLCGRRLCPRKAKK